MMAEAVTKKFVHEESSSIMALCGEFSRKLFVRRHLGQLSIARFVSPESSWSDGAIVGEAVWLPRGRPDTNHMLILAS